MRKRPPALEEPVKVLKVGFIFLRIELRVELHVERLTGIKPTGCSGKAEG